MILTFSIDKCYPLENLGDKLIAFNLLPRLSRFKNELEHHGESGKPVTAALGLFCP